MSIFDITSVSSKGQIVIPNKIRETMRLEPGAKLIVIQDGDNILLKPIKEPGLDQFEKIISLGDKIRNDLKLNQNDIHKAIDDVRKEERASHR